MMMDIYMCGTGLVILCSGGGQLVEILFMTWCRHVGWLYGCSGCAMHSKFLRDITPGCRTTGLRSPSVFSNKRPAGDKNTDCRLSPDWTLNHDGPRLAPWFSSLETNQSSAELQRSYTGLPGLPLFQLKTEDTILSLAGHCCWKQKIPIKVIVVKCSWPGSWEKLSQSCKDCQLIVNRSSQTPRKIQETSDPVMVKALSKPLTPSGWSKVVEITIV